MVFYFVSYTRFFTFVTCFSAWCLNIRSGLLVTIYSPFRSLGSRNLQSKVLKEHAQTQHPFLIEVQLIYNIILVSGV